MGKCQTDDQIYTIETFSNAEFSKMYLTKELAEQRSWKELKVQFCNVKKSFFFFLILIVNF